MKICSKCKKEKPLNCFYKDRSNINGFASSCKLCQKPISAIYYAAHKEEVKLHYNKYCAENKKQLSIKKKEYRQLNKESIAIKERLYRINNPEKMKEKTKIRYAKNKEQWKAAAKKWRADNPEKARAIYRRNGKRILNTPMGKLNRNIARGIHHSVKAKTKNGRHWESLVNFNIEQLKSHLEKQFTDEMSWNNQGSHWHIDHIKPKASFNFNAPEDVEFKRCWALDNLQPLEAKANLSKGSRVIHSSVCGM